MAVYVRYKSLYIPLPSSAKQQREMTKFFVVWRTWTTTANILKFYFKFIAVSQIHFLIDVVFGVTVLYSSFLNSLLIESNSAFIQICPEMQDDQMHAVYDKHHKVSSFLKTH